MTTITAAEIVRVVEQCGFTLAIGPHGPTAQRKPDAKTGFIPSAVMAELKAHRDEVIAWLKRPPEVDWQRCQQCHAECRTDLWRQAPSLCPMPKVCPLKVVAGRR